MSTENNYYDLAIIGGGLSGSLMLVRLLDRLINESASSPVPLKKIVVFDKRGAFGRGIPYGDTSAQPGFLLIGKVSESTPWEFQQWLLKHREALLEQMRQSDDAALLAWVQQNGAALTEGKIGSLYVPRRIFGQYISELLDSKISTATQKGLAAISFIADEVVDLRKTTSGRFCLSAKKSTIEARLTLMAVGSIPRETCHEIGVAEGYVHDIWDQGYDSVRQAINTRFAAQQRKIDVILMGSAATAGELVYFLAHSADLLSKLNSILVVSRSGYLVGVAPGTLETVRPDRPAALEYRQAANRLLQAGLLTVQSVATAPTARLTDAGRLEVVTLDDACDNLIADVVLNCRGMGALGYTSSQLLKNMARPGSSFQINDIWIGFNMHPGSTETIGVEGCFIMGPLLNNVTIETHVESIHGVYRAVGLHASIVYERLMASE